MESKPSIQMFLIFLFNRFLTQPVPEYYRLLRVLVSQSWLAAKLKSMISPLKLGWYFIKVPINHLKCILKKTLLRIGLLFKPKHYLQLHSEQFLVQIDQFLLCKPYKPLS